MKSINIIKNPFIEKLKEKLVQRANQVEIQGSRVSVWEYEIASSPTVRLNDLSRRRFSVLDRAEQRMRASLVEAASIPVQYIGSSGRILPTEESSDTQEPITPGALTSRTWNFFIRNNFFNL